MSTFTNFAHKGPWDNEPDKQDWFDEATGYFCHIRRVSHSGHLCGYVGVRMTTFLMKSREFPSCPLLVCSLINGEFCIEHPEDGPWVRTKSFESFMADVRALDGVLVGGLEQ